jgi:hypothetical protein
MTGSIAAAAVQDSTSAARTGLDLLSCTHDKLFRNSSNNNHPAPTVGLGPLPFGLGGAAASGAAIIYSSGIRRCYRWFIIRETITSDNRPLRLPERFSKGIKRI